MGQNINFVTKWFCQTNPQIYSGRLAPNIRQPWTRARDSYLSRRNIHLGREALRRAHALCGQASPQEEEGWNCLEHVSPITWVSTPLHGSRVNKRERKAGVCSVKFLLEEAREEKNFFTSGTQFCIKFLHTLALSLYLIFKLLRCKSHVLHILYCSQRQTQCCINNEYLIKICL